jgi:hypothetical protein
MTTPKDKDDFFLMVAYALQGCQLVEQALKLYIAEALELAKQCIGQKIPFKMSGKDYDNLPLGQLIVVFHKLSDDETLVKDLVEFRKKRNRLSHKGITRRLDPDGELDGCGMSEFDDELATIAPEAQRLTRAIFEKSAVLGFENLTDAG